MKIEIYLDNISIILPDLDVKSHYTRFRVKKGHVDDRFFEIDKLQ